MIIQMNIMSDLDRILFWTCVLAIYVFYKRFLVIFLTNLWMLVRGAWLRANR